MQKLRVIACTLCTLILLASANHASAGAYNPISDTDWRQMTKDIGFAGACSCKDKGIPIGVKFHYWEPIATLEVIRKPWSMPSFGIGGSKTTKQAGHFKKNHQGKTKSFWQVHYVKYPVFAVLQLADLVICGSLGSIDIGYMSEIDPTWNDGDLSLLMDFAALLTNNPIAQLACLPDALVNSAAAAANGSISVMQGSGITQKQAQQEVQRRAKSAQPGSTSGSYQFGTKVQMYVPITNWMFWCAGAWGPIIPASGHQNHVEDQTVSAALEAARALYKMQKYAELWGTDNEWLVGAQNAHTSSDYCSTYPMPHQFLIKDKYRLNIAKPIAARATPIGAVGPMWEIGKGFEKDGYVFVVWRFKKCCISLPI